MAADFADQAICLSQSRVMRIENTARSSSVSARSGINRNGNGGGFFIAEEPAVSHASAATATAPTAGIDALLALQAVEDPLFRGPLVGQVLRKSAAADGQTHEPPPVAGRRTGLADWGLAD